MNSSEIKKIAQLVAKELAQQAAAEKQQTSKPKQAKKRDGKKPTMNKARKADNQLAQGEKKKPEPAKRKDKAKSNSKGTTGKPAKEKLRISMHPIPNTNCIAVTTSHNIGRYWKSKKVHFSDITDIIWTELDKAFPTDINLRGPIAFLRSKEYLLAKLGLEEILRNTSTSRNGYLISAVALAAISKVATPETNIDAEQYARAKFYRTEHQTKRINEWLMCFAYGRWNDSTKLTPDWWGAAESLSHNFRNFRLLSRKELATVLHVQRTMLSSIAKPNIARASALASHGPGATTTVRGKSTSFLFKYNDYTVTERAIPLVAEMLSYDSATWELLGFDLARRGNSMLREQVALCMRQHLRSTIGGADVLRFVPKNMESLRTITIGNTLNVYAQLGFGRQLAEELKSNFGIDLHDQELNQKLARLGSRDGTYATIDLRSASDTVLPMHVALLLPEWEEILDQLRGSRIKDGDHEHSLSLFAGMGNGYAFPLETAVFASCLAGAAYIYGYKPEQAVREAEKLLRTRRAAVYGDDIVVPSELAGPMLSVLYANGFLPNPQKTFADGPFRESCGKDYWGGHPVRPIFVRSDDKGMVTVESLVALHNNLIDFGQDSEVVFPIREITKKLRQLYREKCHPVIPVDPSGQHGFITEEDVPVHTYSRRYQRYLTFQLHSTPTNSAGVKVEGLTNPVNCVLNGAQSWEMDVLVSSLRYSNNISVRTEADQRPLSKGAEVLRLICALKGVHMRKLFGNLG